MTNETKTILIVDSNPQDARSMAELLQGTGYEAVIASSGNEALQLFEEKAPHLVITELALQEGMDGFDICKHLRARSQVPIMVVSSRNEEVDVVLSLELGADEFVAKPYRPRELVARVRTLLRRAVTAETAAIQQRHLSYPYLEIDVPTRTAVVGETEVHLTPKEFDLLVRLASQPRRVFTRQELVEQVWGYSAGEGDVRTVDTHIKRLRNKLRPGHEVPWAISTVWGVGYRFDIRQE
jgi:DNA-binding response OmpR family regulator